VINQPKTSDFNVLARKSRKEWLKSEHITLNLFKLDVRNKTETFRTTLISTALKHVVFIHLVNTRLVPMHPNSALWYVPFNKLIVTIILNYLINYYPSHRAQHAQ